MPIIGILQTLNGMHSMNLQAMFDEAGRAAQIACAARDELSADSSIPECDKQRDEAGQLVAYVDPYHGHWCAIVDVALDEVDWPMFPGLQCANAIDREVRRILSIA